MGQGLKASRPQDPRKRGEAEEEWRLCRQVLSRGGMVGRGRARCLELAAACGSLRQLAQLRYGHHLHHFNGYETSQGPLLGPPCGAPCSARSRSGTTRSGLARCGRCAGGSGDLGSLARLLCGQMEARWKRPLHRLDVRMTSRSRCSRAEGPRGREFGAADCAVVVVSRLRLFVHLPDTLISADRCSIS